MSTVLAFAAADLRSLGRDPLMRALLVAPVALVAVLPLGVPLVERWVIGSFSVDLGAYRPVLVAFLACVVVPLVAGALGGLLLLEDRASGVLPAIAVATGLFTYLAVRSVWVAVAAAVATGGGLALLGGTPNGTVVAVAALSAGAAVVVLLAVGTVAGDRIEGVAVTKAAMLPLSAALLAWIVPAPWAWLLMVLPTYAPITTLWSGSTGEVGPALLVGTAQLGVLTAITTTCLRRRAV